MDLILILIPIPMVFSLRIFFSIIACLHDIGLAITDACATENRRDRHFLAGNAVGHSYCVQSVCSLTDSRLAL